MAKWHPIATMPKDGRFVLVCDGRHCRVRNAPQGRLLGWWTQRKDGTWGGSADTVLWSPTHWTALPPLPREEAQ